MKTYRLVSCALLSGAALALQLANPVIGIHTGFGMTVDLVALPILLALFVFGFEASFYVLLATAAGIALVAPTGIVGAAAKFIATLPMLLIPAAFLLWKERKAASALAFGLLGLVAAVVAYAFAGIALAYLGGAKADFLAGALLPLSLLAVASYIILQLSKKYGQGDASALSSVPVAAVALGAALLVRGALMVLANLYIAGPIYFSMTPDQLIGFLQKADLLLFGTGTAWYAVIFFWNIVQGAIEFALAWLLAYRFGLSKYGKQG